MIGAGKPFTIELFPTVPYISSRFDENISLDIISLRLSTLRTWLQLSSLVQQIVPKTFETNLGAL